MIKKDILKEIIKDFHSTTLPKIKKRDIDVPIGINKIITFSGVRRSGKTYMLYDTIRKLHKSKVAPQKILYINFEDERLELSVKELDMLIQAYRELYPDIDLSKCFFFFDEVQNINGWERFVRRVDDSITKNIFITGSNSRLLSREIATSLRGRTLTIEVFPLTFKEYLNFNGVSTDIYDSLSRPKIINRFEKYLFSGGFPEVATIKDTSIRNQILQEYFDMMLYRDLIERFSYTNLAVLKYFIKRIFESISSPVSVNKIYNELKSMGYKIGKNTLYDFIESAQFIYLFLSVQRYVDSVIKRQLAKKKFYAIDNGLLNATTFKFSNDYGKLLENLVLLELIKKGIKVYFYKDSKECDFVTIDKSGSKKVIQVSYVITDSNTKNREFDGLVSACKRFGLKEGTIITLSEEEEVNLKGIEVKIVPAYKYLLRLN